jgi:hypothetical protein
LVHLTPYVQKRLHYIREQGVGVVQEAEVSASGPADGHYARNGVVTVEKVQ